MSDLQLVAPDPEHHPNPNYKGIDYFALEFVKKREKILERVQAQQAAQGPVKHTEAVITESEVKSDIAIQNARYASGALKREIINSYYNHPLILHDFATGLGANMAGAQGMGPALIIGSGPTLDDCHELIKGWKGGIFCSTSQCLTMLALGKRDFYIAAVDVKTESDEFLPLDVWEDKDVKFITHPGMDPECIQTWRWKKLYFRIIVHQMNFYTEVLPLAYPMITTTMYVYGCSASAQVSMASIMGYNPLFLCGCDFGYPYDRPRFRPYNRVNGEWILAEPHKPVQYIHHAKVIYRNGCSSDSLSAYYKQTLMNVWRLSLSDIFVVGDKGGLYELPHVSQEEVARGEIKLSKYMTNKDKIEISERYLLQYGTYTFEYPSGQVEFVVFEHGDDDLPRYIDIVNQSFMARKMPGILNLDEERSRLSYLRDNEVWARKEAKWQWATKSPQSPMEIIPETSSKSE